MDRSFAVRTGKWCKEEDDLLKARVQKFGEGKWHLVPQRAGLKRCRKSCRLRWLNYLKPDIKRGDFAEDEVDMMTRLHRLLGNRWSLIAGRLPGRTPNDVKNYWYTNMREKGQRSPHKKELKEKAEEITMKTHTPTVIKPRAFSFSRNSSWLRKKPAVAVSDDDNTSSGANEQPEQVDKDSMEWWKSLLQDNDIEKEGQQNGSSLSSSMTEQDGKLDLFWDEELNYLD